jgi:tetratricopeptide (TPR) repeat protein
MSAYAYIILSIVSSTASLHEEAISAALKAVEYDPEAFSSWHWLGNSYHWAGNLPAALRPFTRALEISGRHNWTLTSLVVTYADGGQTREANVIYNELLTKSKLSYVSPACLSIAAGAMDRNEEAIRYAQLAYERRDPYLVQGLLPYWANSTHLRRLPEYGEFLRLLAL